MSGGGLASDSTGLALLHHRRRRVHRQHRRVDYGDSYIKMTPAGVVADYFTPHDQAALDHGNLDLGSGGAAAASRSAGRASAPDGQRRQGRHDLPRRPRQHGPLQRATNTNVQTLAEHLPERHAGARATSARRSTSTATCSSARWQTRAGVQADERPALDEPDAPLPGSYPDRGASLTVSANSPTANGILWAVQRNGAAAGDLVRTTSPRRGAAC